MNTVTKPIHLRNDEYNDYIEENKDKLITSDERSISYEEKQVIERTAVEYGLTIGMFESAESIRQEQKKYNIVLRIKGNFTLPKQSQFRSENGTVLITPYIIHDDVFSKRFHIIARELCDKKLVDSPVLVDSEYMYEALRETSFNMEMEEITKMGIGMQILQIEFDAYGHFKVIELDETIIN